MKEFAYLKKADFIDDLGKNIAVINSPTSEKFLIANDKALNALIYAPEIDFYIKNSSAFNNEKLEKLYEARAINYDYSSEINLYANIDKRICILFDDKDLKNKLIDNGYKAVCVSEFEFVYGGIGSLVVVTKEGELDCDLAISQTKLNNHAVLINHENILQDLNSLTGKISFTRKIEFNSSLCQLDGRRSEHCGWCVEACPSVALSTDDKKIIISEIDCINCAKCVSVCPTNALEFCEFNKDCIKEISKIYENEQIIITQNYDNNFNIKHFLPFNIPFDLLDELILLHLINTTCKSIAIVGDISEFLAEKINLVNDICKAITGKIAIYVNANLDEIPNELIKEFKSSESNFRLNKRELFGLKISSMLNNLDKGVINAKNYAKISINESTCTLCASCAGACNTNAILADSKENAIKFNASLCTSCGYCINSCAEKDTIFIQNDILELNPISFTHKTLAKDELFACIECGKEFATKKSIDKIAGILGAAFSSDVTKKYSLYCCADCKAKIMMLKQAQVFDDTNSFFAPLEEKLNKFLKG